MTSRLVATLITPHKDPPGHPYPKGYQHWAMKTNDQCPFRWLDTNFEVIQKVTNDK